MMTGKQLKNAILQLAIQGKLVPQDANDEPASVLLAQIRKEKEQLVKAGKLKKKDLETTPISDEEKPFEIPESWEWVRLGEIVRNNGQKKPETIFSYIDIGSIDNKRQKLNSDENLIESSKAPSRARKIVKFGDIIYSTVRPYLHNMAIVDKEFSKEPIASTGFAVLTTIKLYNKYLFYYLMSPQFDEYANDGDNAKGIAYPAINDAKLYKASVPLPPLAEQHRIVSKIEELMPLVEEYGVAQEKLNHLNAALPAALKKSILQQAIQGKLVPQDANDEPASALLAQIRKEKEQLVKAGKLKKKDLATTPITDEEKPFEIPESWEWVRLGEITDVLGGYAFQSQDIKGEKGTRVIRISDFNENGWVNNKIARYNDKEQLNQFEIKINDILLAMTGGTVGKSFFIENLPERMLLNQRVALIRSLKAVPKFVDLLIKSPLIQNIINECKNSTNDNISMGDIIGFVVPLPPLAEQKRIVARVEELLAMVERMK